LSRPAALVRTGTLVAPISAAMGMLRTYVPFTIGSVVCVVLVCAIAASSEPVPVRFTEGLVHGFLKLSTTDGTQLADGDLLQTAQGTQVTSRLVFRFKDKSTHEETSVYSQQGRFRLVSYHLNQKGPSFPRTLDMTIDASGVATVRYTDEHGQQKTESERLKLPAADLSNGMMLTLLKNVRAGAVPAELSLVVATPKPRVVTLKLSSAGEETFSTGGMQRKAIHYVVKVDIGGLAGLVAPILGKQPPDSHVWILAGDVPAFVKSEQLFYMGAPLWRVELVSPVWPHAQPAR
jgi:hypothetical protein